MKLKSYSRSKIREKKINIIERTLIEFYLKLLNLHELAIEIYEREELEYGLNDKNLFNKLETEIGEQMRRRLAMKKLGIKWNKKGERIVK